jgi:hypothetical protein
MFINDDEGGFPLIKINMSRWRCFRRRKQDDIGYMQGRIGGV